MISEHRGNRGIGASGQQRYRSIGATEVSEHRGNRGIGASEQQRYRSIGATEVSEHRGIKCIGATEVSRNPYPSVMLFTEVWLGCSETGCSETGCSETGLDPFKQIHLTFVDTNFTANCFVYFS